MEALVSAQSGLAFVVDGTVVHSIHAKAPEIDVPRRPHELRWLLGDAQDVVVLEDVERPDIVGFLAREKNREDSLLLLGAVLDGDSAVALEIRQEAARDLEGLLSLDGVAVDLENLLYATRLPDSADLVGASSWVDSKTTPQVHALLAGLERNQDTIASVRRAWDELPDDLFVGSRVEWRVQAIRLGLFRQLVLNRLSTRELALRTPDALSNLRVLKAWKQGRFFPTSQLATYESIGPTKLVAMDVREPEAPYDAEWCDDFLTRLTGKDPEHEG